MFNKIIEEDMKVIYDNAAFDWMEFSGKTVLITGAYGMLASYMMLTLEL